MEGTHTIRYYSRDYLNNTEEEREQQVRIDENAPKTTIEYIGPSYREETRDWITSDTQIVLNATDQQKSGVNKTYYRLDEGPWFEYLVPFTLEEGTYHLKYYTTDKVANKEDAWTQVVMVNDTPPVVTIDKPQEGYLHLFGRPIMPLLFSRTIVVGRINVTLELTDPSGIRKIEFFVDEELEYTAEESPFIWTWDAFNIGYRTLKIIATNHLGHFTTETLSLLLFNI